MILIHAAGEFPSKSSQKNSNRSPDNSPLVFRWKKNNKHSSLSFPASACSQYVGTNHFPSLTKHISPKKEKVSISSLLRNCILTKRVQALYPGHCYAFRSLWLSFQAREKLKQKPIKQKTSSPFPDSSTHDSRRTGRELTSRNAKQMFIDTGATKSLLVGP